MLLTVCMVGATLAGCSASSSAKVDPTSMDAGDSSSGKDKTDKTDVTSTLDMLADSDVAANITSFAGNSPDTGYVFTDPVYGVPIDYVFEFEASDEAREFGIQSFAVYTSEKDLAEAVEYYQENGEIKARNYGNVDTSEDGKIYVAPPGSIDILEEGIKYPDIDHPSWGIYNRLFLAQWIDLETGEILDEPIVTIFSVDHGIDAPVVSQGIDDENYYTLTWEPIAGAEEYAVFSTLDDHLYSYEGSTTDVSFNILESEAEQEAMLLFAEFTDDYTGAVCNMNYSIHSDVNSQFEKNYVVFAVSGDLLSGMSNYIDPSDIAGFVPYEAFSTATYEIEKGSDVPVYSEVTMADDSKSQMLINYNGAPIYELEDGSIYIAAKFYNTNLQCNLKFTGITIDELKEYKDEIKERMEKEAAIIGGAHNPSLTTSLVPTADEDEKNEEVEEIINETIGNNDADTDDDDDDDIVEPGDDDDDDDEVVEPDDDDDDDDEVVEPGDDDDDVVEPDDNDVSGPTTTVTPSGYTTTELYGETLLLIDSVYKEYDIDTKDLSKILYANNELEAYLAFALTARMEVIPVPTELFPESVDTEYLFGQFIEAYRQNPTSGLITGYKYVFEYESILVAYSEDTSDRLTKTKKEMDAAKNIANSVVDSSMSDEEKVYAINDYFCENASYDFDSMSTNVSIDDLSEEYLDAHNPYGILCNNYGVCESYSEAFAMTARNAGINAIMETGYLSGGKHEWNKVMIDGKYYIVDVTNNDLDVLSNTLLLVSEDTALVLSADTYSFTFSAPATDDSKDYYKYVDRIASSDDEAISLLEEQLDEYGSGSVRMDYDITEEDMLRILKAVYEDGYDLNGYGNMNNVIGTNIH